MRRALYCALSLTTFAPWAFSGSNLTVILDFKGPHSNGAVSEMQRETETIFKDSGLHLDWRFREEALHASYDDLVLVRFRGACVLEPAPYPPYLYDELGPSETLAFTHTTDGAVLPFSEVACNKVAASARSTMHGGDFARSDLFLGRALGRVLAHELVHILTGSGKHGREGVEKRALSGRQLTEESLPLSSDDLERLRRAFLRPGVKLPAKLPADPHGLHCGPGDSTPASQCSTESPMLPPD